jgi:hypothetical protein
MSKREHAENGQASEIHQRVNAQFGAAAAAFEMRFLDAVSRQFHIFIEKRAFGAMPNAL